MLKTIENLEQARDHNFDTSSVIKDGYRQASVRLGEQYEFGRTETENSINTCLLYTSDAADE